MEDINLEKKALMINCCRQTRIQALTMHIKSAQIKLMIMIFENLNM